MDVWVLCRQMDFHTMYWKKLHDFCMTSINNKAKNILSLSLEKKIVSLQNKMDKNYNLERKKIF